jgi:small conductance mechanosensitive channel
VDWKSYPQEPPMPPVPPVLHDAWNQATAFLATYGLSALGGIVLLFVGWTLAGWASRAVDVTLARVPSVDLTLRRFIASLVRYVILTFTVLAVLSQFGVQTASLIAVFGAAGLAIGLALQGTLANLAAGVMILIFRPFKIGDQIDGGGAAGTVESIDLFVTALRTADNLQLLVPNGKIWGAAITNFSVHTSRRVDLKAVVDGAMDLDAAMSAVRETITRDARARQTPAPSVTVVELGEATVTLAAQVWCAAADYGDLKVTLMKALKQRLQASLKTLTG